MQASLSSTNSPKLCFSEGRKGKGLPFPQRPSHPESSGTTGRAVEEGNLEREIPRDGVPGNMSLIPC